MSTLPWGYGKDNGPSVWSRWAPSALGKHQSPIDIVTSEVHHRASLPPLHLAYTGEHCKRLANNGHSVQVDADDCEQCVLRGGPLSDTYRLKQFHFHWGGSEHTIDGTRYAAELHIVHWNSSKYETMDEAVKHEDGLAVLAAFIDTNEDEDNNDYAHLTKHFKEIETFGHQAVIKEGIHPRQLLPGDLTRYWTYEGSLTTPPCLECVRFIIFKQPVQISKKQLEAFKRMEARPSHEDPQESKPFNLAEKLKAANISEGLSASITGILHLASNYRPVMPLNQREVVASFL